eukprot:COSAG02_NODE_1271_length_13526_cov_6.207865_5_plen_228_part_00
MKLKDMPSNKTPATYKRAKNRERQLRYASWEGNLTEVQELASIAEVDVNTVDGDGFSPLLIAVRWNRLEVAKVLLEVLQADITLRTCEGDSAYNLAEIHGHTEMAVYLKRKGCSCAPNELREQRSASGQTWLLAALPQTVCKGPLTFGSRSTSAPPSGVLESPTSPPSRAPSSPVHSTMQPEPELEPEPEPEPEPELEPELELEPHSKLAEGVPPLLVWKCDALSDD